MNTRTRSATGFAVNDPVADAAGETTATGAPITDVVAALSESPSAAAAPAGTRSIGVPEPHSRRRGGSANDAEADGTDAETPAAPLALNQDSITGLIAPTVLTAVPGAIALTAADALIVIPPGRGARAREAPETVGRARAADPAVSERPGDADDPADPAVSAAATAGKAASAPPTPRTSANTPTRPTKRPEPSPRQRPSGLQLEQSIVEKCLRIRRAGASNPRQRTRNRPEVRAVPEFT